MNYNAIGYLIFFAEMFYIIGIIGWSFYINGKHYLEQFFPNDIHLIGSINRFLLIGYYLLNLGYIAISIQFWKQIYTLANLIETLAQQSGEIILILALAHYFNLFWLSHFQQIKSFINQNKI